MTEPLVLVPLDDRPPTYYFPQRIAAIAGIPLILPPREMLGQFLCPGETGQIAEWLIAQARNRAAEAAIVAADMLTYGGLIASRTSKTNETEAIQRANTFLAVKNADPNLRLMVASVIMRISITASDETMAKYYRDLIRYSELSWLVEQEKRKDLQEEYYQVLKRIPSEVINQYLTVRRRNHQVNRRMIELLAQGTIDDLILTQEDASLAGPHLGEHRALYDLARSLGVEKRVHLYPGADEGTQTLLARWLNRVKAPKVQIRYTSLVGAQQAAPFEDRPIRETVTAQLSAAGVLFTDDEQPVTHPDQAILWVHTPCTSEEVEQAASEIETMVHARAQVALADVRFPNGSDPEIMAILCQAGVLPRLAAYAGWNTAGNTLGTTIASLCASLVAQAKDFPEGQGRIQRDFLWERYVDDWGYQRVIREQIAARLCEQGIDSYNLADSYHIVENEVRVELGAWAAKAAIECNWMTDLPTLHFSLPWPRIFEVAVSSD